MGDRRRVLLTGLQSGYLATLVPAWRRYLRSARDPARAQATRLRVILGRIAGSAYARAHGLDASSSLEDLRARAPIVDFEALRPWVDRIAAGESGVLTQEPVRMLERTSGSSGGNKLVPYTPGLLEEFSAATGPWLASLYLHRPRMIGTTSYWSVSPAARDEETTAGGVPIGFEDDTEYFGPLARWALGKLMTVPGTVARIRELETWRFETARRLVADAHLGMISVWSPTFLSRMAEVIEREHAAIAKAVPPARAAALDDVLARYGRLEARALWPRLALVSCWTDAQAARFVPELARSFSGVEVQGKGLLATEGAVTFPLTTSTAPEVKVLSLDGHFFEFIDLDAPSGAVPRLAHELRAGGRYSPLLTTSGGLVRYHLKDELRCTGHHAAAPVLELVGRVDRTSDLAGEKLTAPEVDRAIAGAEAETGARWGFALLAPAAGAPIVYQLFLEGPHGDDVVSATAAAVERRLCLNHHYRYCRDLGQLGPVRGVRVAGGWRRYEGALVARGMRAGDIKPTHLDTRTFWSEVFEAPEAARSRSEGSR
ncbi:GH3 auxin-responsive promoter family protein [Myxococcota bacterium]|nr:GH3 auxin-responsive promoter family protein [Myxococcota bacterium]